MISVIKSEPFFIDINKSDSFDNFLSLINDICNISISEEMDYEKTTKKKILKDIHYILKVLNTKKSTMHKCFSIFNYTDYDLTVGCCEFMADKNKPVNIFLPELNYRIHACIGVHESIHAIQGINGLSLEQYDEFLPQFGELLTASKIFHNRENDFLSVSHNVILSDRIICANDFMEDLQNNSNNDAYISDIFNSYIYLLGYFFTLQLFEKYQDDPKNVLQNVRKVLKNSLPMSRLIKYYDLGFKEENCKIVKEKIKELI